jgi:AMP-polyphosphate phosphotransferase
MANSARIDALRNRLLTAQTRLTREKTFALAIIVIGEPTAGRSEVVNKFLEWLDPKHISVHALDPVLMQDDDDPPMERYWRTLPARGEIAIYFQGWYEDYLAPALHTPKVLGRKAERLVAQIKQLERMLTHDGVRVLKLDLRVARQTQQARIKTLRASKATRWRVTREDRWLAKHFGRVRKVTDSLMKATDAAYARWHVIDGTDPDKRLLDAGSLVQRELETAHKRTATAVAKAPKSGATKASKRAFVTRPPEALDGEQYAHELETLQGRLALLSRKKSMRKRAVVLAFEGMDAAGKGGTIRRLTGALDARQYTVVPISAPTPEELAHPYLWRFWRRLPDRGEFAIFDRTWYGRVLVERVRGFAAAADWQRAYAEINEFELQLVESRIIVRKFWLAVGKDEQLKRFEEREEDALKRFKVDQEDWANRRLYDAYQAAARDMIERTNTDYAPWTVVPADDKRYARLQVLRAVCDALTDELKK